MRLLTPVDSNAFREVPSLLFPSIPSPEIQVESFVVDRVYKDPNEDYGFLCDISVKGRVTCSTCNYIKGDDGVISGGTMDVNDSRKRIHPFEIAANKTNQAGNYQPYPFTGYLDFSIAGLAICEGVNTFRLMTVDPRTGIEGYSLWAASFEFPWDDDYEDEPPENSVREPRVSEEPRFVEGAMGGEFYPVLIGESSVSDSSQLTIADNRFSLRQCGDSDFAVACDLERGRPLYFIARPTNVACEKELLEALQGASDRSDHYRFLRGYFLGCYATGFELVSIEDGSTLNLKYSSAADSFCVNSETHDASDALSVASLPTEDFLLPENALPNILWRLVEAVRSDESRSVDLCIALLTGSLATEGIEDAKMEDWRGYTTSTVAEMIEDFLVQFREDGFSKQGYMLGRLIGEILRCNLAADAGPYIQDSSKADFLEFLGTIQFFQDDKLGGPAMKAREDLIKGMRRFCGC